MIDFLESAAERELHEYFKYWDGYYEGTWIPKNLYAKRCYDRYERFSAVARCLKHISRRVDDDV
jgi:hypothetical protein